MIKASKQQKICVVIPAFNEEGNISLVAEGLLEVLKKERFEIIVVDDGSGDQTAEMVRKISLKDPRVRLVQLSRNFGHISALSAGLERVSDADVVIIMDADLQHPPQTITQMLEYWRKGFLVVRMQRKNYAHPPIKILLSKLFYWTTKRMLTYPPVPRSPEFMLLDKQVIATLLKLKDKNFTLRSVVSWLGYKTLVLPFQEQPRHSGKSGYSLAKSISMTFSTLFYLTTTPLKLGFLLGSIGIIASLALVGWVVLGNTTQNLLQIWILTLITFLASIQLIVLGVIGAYLGVVVKNIRHIPPYIVLDEDTQ